MYFLIFLICQFSRHIPGPTVCVSPFPCFSVFLPYSGSNTVCFHFPHFNVSRHIPGSTLCVSHICFVLQVYRHIPGPTVCNSHFPPFSVFLAIFQVIECLCLIFHGFSFLAIFLFFQFAILIFHFFQCFFKYFTSYSVCFSFSKIFTFLAIF